MAEISVPAWPMPIHQTKLMIAKPQRDRDVDPPNPHAAQQQIRHRVEQHHHDR